MARLTDHHTLALPWRVRLPGGNTISRGDRIATEPYLIDDPDGLTLGRPRIRSWSIADTLTVETHFDEHAPIGLLELPDEHAFTVTITDRNGTVLVERAFESSTWRLGIDRTPDALDMRVDVRESRRLDSPTRGRVTGPGGTGPQFSCATWSERYGRLTGPIGFTDRCPDCGHIAIAHDTDTVECSICTVERELRATHADEIRALRARVEELDDDHDDVWEADTWR